MLITGNPAASETTNATEDFVELAVDEYALAEQSLIRSRTDRHRTMLCISVIVLVLSFALAIRGTGDSASVTVGEVQLPSLCSSRSWFGIECPGCGLTRSFIALASGDLEASFRYHRLGWLLFSAVVLQIPYRILSLRELRKKVVLRKWPSWFGMGIVVSLIVNWLVRFVL